MFVGSSLPIPLLKPLLLIPHRPRWGFAFPHMRDIIGVEAYFTPGSVVCVWEPLEFPIHLHEVAAVEIRLSHMTQLTVSVAFG